MLFTVYLLAIIPSTVPHPLKLWNQSVSALEVRAFIAHLFGCFQCLQISLSMSTCMKNQGLPWWLSGKESSCQRRRCKRCWFNPLVRKIPWRRKWQPNILAWRIPGTEKPGRLWSMGWQRVGHDRSNAACLHACGYFPAWPG